MKLPNAGNTNEKPQPTDYVLLVARCLMSIEFIFFGIMKTINTANMQAYMESFGVPGVLIWPVIVVQIGCGALVVVGFQTRLAALALAGFCIIATTIFHTQFYDGGVANLGQVSDFTKDLATTGGFLFLFVFGPGKLSLERLLKQNK